MITKSYGLSLVWGIPSPIPHPPPGWTYNFQSEDWGSIKSPDKKEYYVSIEGWRIEGFRKKKVTLWDVFRTRGKLKLGEFYLDERERIDL